MELIDARSLVPFNYEPVIESVKKTGRILLTSDANERGSFLKDMAQNITEMCFDDLDAPPVVVGARNWIIPAHELEDFYLKQELISLVDEVEIKSSSEAIDVSDHQQQMVKVFYAIWFQDDLSTTHINFLHGFLSSELIQDAYKSFMVSSLTLSLQRYFDADKFSLLFDFYDFDNDE